MPGPVFVEVPVDVLYPEATVREWYLKEAGVEGARSLGQKALGLYLKGHLYRQFHVPSPDLAGRLPKLRRLHPTERAKIEDAAAMLAKAERPALVIGSQTMVNCLSAGPLARAVEALAMPTWLGGMARGLLGRDSPTQFRHARGKALKDADVVLVCGFPFDFRLKYGLGFGKKTKVIAVNLSAAELHQNRKPELAIQMPAADFLVRLSGHLQAQERWLPFVEACRKREQARDAEIAAKAKTTGPLVDPVHFFQRLEAKLADDAVLVADGGDFVATAAYLLKPRGPLSWLDPGVFGTLGVGGGFAAGACAVRPKSEVWIIYGDGSCAYSLAEFDTFVRHGLAPIAVIGTDGAWGQIARDQVTILGSGVATTLRRTDYHLVARGLRRCGAVAR